MKNFFLFIILVFFAFDGSAQCDRQRDSLALVEFYNSLNGRNWNSSWDLSRPLDNWSGVFLSNSGCVERIRLNSNRLLGTIPNDICQLRELTSLELSWNDIYQPLPTCLGDLTSLNNLNLSVCNLDGTFPVEVLRIPSLENLSLAQNNITGTIPDSIGNLVNLISLRLGNNDLVEPVPQSFANLTKLEELSFNTNELTTVPIPFTELESLKILGLSHNQIESIPPEIENLLNLEELDLWSNVIETIPYELGNLQNLVILNLRSNQITGLPLSLSYLDKLTNLNLSNNNLSGCIPEFICDISYSDLKLNPLLPWEGDLDPFCEDGLDQIGAPCNDGDPSTSDEQINEDCQCAVPNSNNEHDYSNIVAYPNPFSDKIIIDLPNSNVQKIEIYNQLGQLVYYQFLSLGKNEISLTHLRSGLYYVKMDGGIDKVLMKK